MNKKSAFSVVVKLVQNMVLIKECNDINVEVVIEFLMGEID